MTPDKFKGRHKEGKDSAATYHRMVNAQQLVLHMMTVEWHWDPGYHLLSD